MNDMRRIILLSLMLSVLLIVGCARHVVLNNSTSNITLEINNTVNDTEHVIDVVNETIINDTLDNITVPVNDIIIDDVNRTRVDNPSNNSEYLRYSDTGLIDESISAIKSLD
jgi:hypothetical protein